MTWQGPLRCCENCGARIGSKTPLYPDPEVLRKAREPAFEPPVEGGIRDIVIGLIANGIETFESREGGPGHSFPKPTVRFEGGPSEGLRAMAVALENGMPVFRRRTRKFKVSFFS
jgi:hypothetical protein